MRTLPPVTRRLSVTALAAVLVSGAAVGQPTTSAAAQPTLTQPGTVPDRVVRAGWPQAGYGPGNTGYNPEASLAASSVDDLRPRWSIGSVQMPSSCTAQSPPVIADGRMFLTDATGFAGYDAATGRRLWRYEHRDPSDTVTPRLAVAGGLLIAAVNTCVSVSDPDGELLALDPATGARRWRVARDAPMYRMVADQGVVAVVGGDAGHDAASGYRLRDGHRLWNMVGAEALHGVSAGGRLLLTRSGGRGAVAVSITSGRRLWSTGARWTALAADPAGNRFYVTDRSNALIAVRAATGARLWTVPRVVDNEYGGGLAVDQTRVYASYGGALSAYASGSGRRLWRQHQGSATYRPVVTGGAVYVVIHDGPMLIMRARDGALLDAGQRYQRMRGHAVVVAGRMYLTDGTRLRTFTR
jgi:outer membrane protein assembly factor BamB